MFSLKDIIKEITVQTKGKEMPFLLQPVPDSQYATLMQGWDYLKMAYIWVNFDAYCGRRILLIIFS